MSQPSQEDYARELEELLRSIGPTSIGFAAKLLDIGVQYTRILVETFPDKFDMVGITPDASSWCIAVTDPKRPIQFVLEVTP